MTVMTTADVLGAETERPAIRYPFFDHVLGLLPLAVLLTVVFLLPGGESDVARHFSALRSALPDATAVMSWLSKYGNVPFYLGYAAIVLHAAKPEGKNGGRFVLRYLFLLALLLLVCDMLKIWIGRPRPGVEGEYVMFSLRKAWHSFPSNHMTETTFSLLSLALFCRSRGITVACGLSVAVMGLARLYLGRHHPTDLAGSAALGSVWVYMLWRWRCAADNASKMP